MSVRREAMQGIDPGLPYEAVTVGGRRYKLCVTYRALAIAEDEMVRRGHDVNLLMAQLRPTLSGTIVMFAAALCTYHPEVTFEEAQALVTPHNLSAVFLGLREAQRKAYPDVEPSASRPTRARRQRPPG